MPATVPAFQPSPSTSKKSSQPSKLVDLGAAATFASQATTATTQKQQQEQSSAAGDLFGIFDGSAQTQQQTAQQGREPVDVSSVVCVCVCVCVLLHFGVVPTYCSCTDYVLALWVSDLTKH